MKCTRQDWKCTLTSFSLSGSIRLLLNGVERMHLRSKRGDTVLQEILDYSLSRELVSTQDLDARNAAHLFRLHLWGQGFEAAKRRRLPSIIKTGLLWLGKVKQSLYPGTEGILQLYNRELCPDILAHPKVTTAKDLVVSDPIRHR